MSPFDPPGRYDDIYFLITCICTYLLLLPLLRQPPLLLLLLHTVISWYEYRHTYSDRGQCATSQPKTLHTPQPPNPPSTPSKTSHRHLQLQVPKSTNHHTHTKQKAKTLTESPINQSPRTHKNTQKHKTNRYVCSNSAKISSALASIRRRNSRSLAARRRQLSPCHVCMCAVVWVCVVLGGLCDVGGMEWIVGE